MPFFNDALIASKAAAIASAALVLESEASVKARSATCYGELIGGLSSSEATGLFSIESEGEHLTDLLKQTLEVAGLSSAEVDLVVAHGNGNKKSDVSEAIAIQKVFSDVPVTAFKWSMGHTLCASGLIDAVLTTYSLQKQCAPGIANLHKLSKPCEGINVSSSHQPLKNSTHAIMINRGFASMNACLVVKACD